MAGDWERHFDPALVDRIGKGDPELDLDSLGRHLERRIESGQIRNPQAVLIVAAREAKERGTHRRKPGISAAPRSSADLKALAAERVRLYAAAARGTTPLLIGEACSRLAARFPGMGLEAEASALIAEHTGWPVDRPALAPAAPTDDSDIPF